MEKPQLNYNEYLRYTFAGGFGVLTYLYLNPTIRQTLFDENGTIKDSLFLVLLSLLLGSFLYAVHRAILYPICYKLNLIILRISGKTNNDLSWVKFIFTQDEVKRQDFRRWKQRANPKSFASNLLDWSAQIHFLYCCVWAMWLSFIFTENITTDNFLKKNWLLFTIILFVISLRNHYRSLLYDIDIVKHDQIENIDKKVKTIELKVETE